MLECLPKPALNPNSQKNKINNRFTVSFMSGFTHDERKIPVTILTGFLGAGKTTLLNHILTDMHGMTFAIIENEFGEVGVDDAILKRKSDEEIIEMNNGCICCTVRGDVSRIVKQILSRKDKKFDGIIVETTGLADPAPVAQTFFIDEAVASLCQLDGIITVVDTKHILQHLQEEKPEGVENESVEQVAFADRILLNKTDLVSAEELNNVKVEIAKINNRVDMIECQHSKVDPKLLIGIKAFDLQRCLEIEPSFLEDGEHSHGHGHSHVHVHSHVHDNSVSSIGFKFSDCDLSLGHLQEFIRSLMIDQGKDLYRYKGVISVKGMDKRFVFQGVHMIFGGDFTEPWKEDEVRESRFIFIGKNLDKKMLEDGFMKCKAVALRFKVGDSVFAKVESEYQRGKIIKLWDEGNPYRIQLENGGEVWGPVDEDLFVRKDPTPAE